MPTWYTSGIETGEITTLEQYAMVCARACGALFSMRDEPLNAAIPNRLEPQTKFYDDIIEKSLKELEELINLSPEECETRAKEKYEKEMRKLAADEKEKQDTIDKYNNIRNSIISWKVPYTLEDLKTFMLGQIDESVKQLDYPERSPVLLAGEEWREKELRNATFSLEYSTKKRDEEIERVKDSNKWLSDLRESLNGL